MLKRLTLIVAVLVLVSTPKMVSADPITYAFTGTFNQPVEGSSTLSGSLTINATPMGVFGQPDVSENGSDVSLTVNIGGQLINFVNTAQNPNIATFDANVQWNGASAYNPSGLPEAEFSAVGRVTEGTGESSSFEMTIYVLGVSMLPANLSTLSLPLSYSSFYFGESDDTEGSTQTAGGNGVITSMEIVSAPEPSALVVFAGLGIAALVFRRYRRSRD